LKRKIFSILFTLVLVVGLSLIPATPAAAATTYNVAQYTLQTGDNAASWSTTQQGSGTHSVLLNYVSGDNSYVEFTPATGTTVNDLATITDGWSWWYYASEAYGPLLELRFTSGDGHVDITVNTAEASPAITTGTTEEVTSASTCIYFGNDATDQTEFSNNTGSVTLAGVLASIDAQAAMTAGSETAAAWVLTRVRAEIGWDDNARTCYIDDIEIAGTTYYGLFEDVIDVAAATGDTISVAAGTYNAETTWPIDVDKALLTIQGAGVTSILAPGAAGQGVIAISADSVTIDGFAITHGTETADATHPTEHTVWVNAEYSTISNNTILTRGGNKAGIYIGGRADPDAESLFRYDQTQPLGHTIQDNIFRNANAGEGWGIFAYELKDSLIHGNTFSGDIAYVDNTVEGAPGTGIIIHKASAATADPSPGGGYVVIEDNTAQYMKYTWLTFSAQFMFVDNDGAGYEKVEASTVEKVIVQNNTVSDSDTGVTLMASEIDGSPYADAAASLTIGSDLVTIGPGNNFHDVRKGVSISDPEELASDQYYGVLNAANIVINNNDIYDASEYGVYNGMYWPGLAAGITANPTDDALGEVTIDAEDNWWGSVNGPEHSGNTFNDGYQGAVVSDSVDYVPWFDALQATGSSFAPVNDTTAVTTFSSIQAAITAASASDTITCAAGTYTEDLTIGTTLTLQSVAGAATTIIYTAGSPDDIVLITAADVTIDGFTIQGDGVAAGAVNGIDVRASGFTIQNNIFVDIYHDNIFTGNSGVAITSGLIDSNTLTGMGTSAAAYRPAINVESFNDTISGVTVSNNTVFAYGGVESAGIQVAETTGAVSAITVSGNTISDCSFGMATWNNFATTTFTDNTITGCDVGVDIYGDQATISAAFTLSENTITGNTTYGIRVRTDAHALTGSGMLIQYNDITGNGDGVSVACTGTVHSNPVAKYNYWGDPSGPTVTTNARGAGDSATVTTVTYEPWLHTTQATVYPSGTRYYAYNWCDLTTGWNIWSTPIALDSDFDTWGEYKALGTDLDLATGASVYYFNGSTQAWVSVTDAYVLTPCDAIYVKVASNQEAPILFSPSTSVPSKTVYAGWNLVSASYIDNMDTPAITNGVAGQTALNSVYYVTGSNSIGYSQVVSPATGQTGWSGVRGAAIDTAMGHDMLPCKGYWVYMTNAGTLAGTVFTPVSPLLP